MHTDPANSGSFDRVADQIGLPLPLIERLSVGVAVADLQGQYLILNRAATELFGLPEAVRSLEESRTGLPVYREDGTTALGVEQFPLSRVLRGEGAISEILRVGEAPGASRWISAHCHPLFDEAGRLSGAAAIYSMIAEEDRVNDHATLLSISRDLAHEISQPLTTISLYARGAIRRVQNGSLDEEEMLEAFEAIHDQAVHAGEIIQRAREVSPWGALQLERANLNALAREMESSARARAASANCGLELDLEPNLPDTDLDPSRIGHLIWRLTEIAVEAMRSVEGTRRLRWSTHAAQDAAELRISEIAAEPPDAGASPFAAKMAQSALCLTICRRIAEEHGGRIELKNDGDGSSACLVLPMSSEV